MLALFLALTIPAVTVEVKLNGLPTAKTHSPTSKSSELPKETYLKSSPSIFIKAISVSGSAPTTVAVYSLLLFSVTDTSVAPATT